MLGQCISECFGHTFIRLIRYEATKRVSQWKRVYRLELLTSLLFNLYWDAGPKCCQHSQTSRAQSSFNPYNTWYNMFLTMIAPFPSSSPQILLHSPFTSPLSFPPLRARELSQQKSSKNVHYTHVGILHIFAYKKCSLHTHRYIAHVCIQNVNYTHVGILHIYVHYTDVGMLHMFITHMQVYYTCSLHTCRYITHVSIQKMFITHMQVCYTCSLQICRYIPHMYVYYTHVGILHMFAYKIYTHTSNIQLE